MDINCIPFNEKQFLIGIDSYLYAKYGKERRFIMSHEFPSDGLEIVDYVPELKREAENILIKKYVSEWFREAHVRGYLGLNKSTKYSLTEDGFKKIEYYRRPVYLFFRNHWKWCVTALSSLVAVFTGIFKYFPCQ